MTDILLINPPLSRYDTLELAPPLGLLMLANNVRHLGFSCVITDMNLPEYRHLGDDPELFYSATRAIVAQEQAAVVGITSMGVNTHVAIRAACEISPFVQTVVLGGIHASAIAEEIAALVPSNVVVAPARRDANGTAWWSSACENAPLCELIEGFDVAPYLTANLRRVVNLEPTRGCKYNCAFCYSPVANPAPLHQSVARVAQDLATAFERGFRHAFLVGDNLTNDVRWFRQFVATIADGSTNLTWNGYATLPDLTAHDVEMAARSGCTSLYLGVDAVTPRQQREWRKSFVKDRVKLDSLLEAAAGSPLQLTFAFIVDLRPSCDDDTLTTLEFARQLASAGADIRLSTLTEYPETDVFGVSVAPRYSEDKLAILMDLPAVVVENPLARRAPRLFPWHTRPLGAQEWRRRLLAVYVAQRSLPPGGPLGQRWVRKPLWRACLDVASELMKIDEIHKTDLAQIVVELSLNHVAC